MKHAGEISKGRPALRLEAYVTSEEARAAVDQLARRLGAAAAPQTRSGTLATAARLVGMAPLGDVLIAEMGQEPLEDCLARLEELTSEGVRVILLGRADDLATYRRVIAAGARDYFVLPLGAEADLTQSLGSDVTGSSAPAPSKHRSIAICGVSGGVGASQLALNLAVAYRDRLRGGKRARNRDARVALLDADLEFGSIAVDLNMDMTSGLLEALQVPARVDHTFFAATMAEALPGLSVYSAEAADSRQALRCREGLGTLLGEMKRDFPVVVTDLPRVALAEQPALTDAFDELVLVMGPGFSSVRSCSRLLHRLSERRLAPRVSVVVSRSRHDAGLRTKEIATALERAVTLELPSAASDLARASVKGKALQDLAPRSRYAQGILRLAEILETPPADKRQARRGFWRRRKG